MTTTGKERTIVVGIDGSDASKAALAWAVDEARLRKATVVAIHAWELPITAFTAYTPAPTPMVSDDDLEKLADATARETVADVLGDDTSVPIETCIRNGHAASVLVDAADGADLLVVGSRGHGGFTGMLLGSVSSAVIHHARCPVVVVRPAEAKAA